MLRGQLLRIALAGSFPTRSQRFLCNEFDTGIRRCGLEFQNVHRHRTGGNDVTTGVPYNVGDWQHLVWTWEPLTDVSPPPMGEQRGKVS